MRFTENDLVDETRNLVSTAPECLRAWSWLLWTSPTVAVNVSEMTVPLLSELERLGTVSSLASYLLTDMKEHLERIYRPGEDAAGPPPGSPVESSSPGGPRILIVDDDALFPMLMVRLLRDLGYQPVSVASGERALELLRAEEFDAVLMDCQMPGLDGYETTRRVRRLEAEAELAHRGRLPIIAVTGQPREVGIEQCVAAGMDDFLSKPPTAMDLVAVLDRLLAVR